MSTVQFTASVSSRAYVHRRPLRDLQGLRLRGLYGEQIDGDIAEAVGRAFARVLAEGAGRPTSELRIGLGRDMRLTAPELAARYREGMIAEGAHVLDAGMVGTEMLYYLVGSRGLDGGLMCTASHNPKAYTGAKLVERAPSPCPATPASAKSSARSEAGRPKPRAAAPPRTSTSHAEFQEAALAFIDASAIRPLKVVLDGGNGMAGADGRADPRAPRRARPGSHLLGAGRRVPRPRAQPAAKGVFASAARIPRSFWRLIVVIMTTNSRRKCAG